MSRIASFVGLDYADSVVQACVMDAAGRRLANRRCENDWRSIAARGKTVAPAPEPVVFTVKNSVSEPLFSLSPRADRPCRAAVRWAGASGHRILYGRGGSGGRVGASRGLVAGLGPSRFR